MSRFEILICHMDRRMLMEDTSDFIEAFWDVLAFDLTYRFDGAVFLDQFNARFWTNTSDSGMEVRSNHNGKVDQLRAG